MYPQGSCVVVLCFVPFFQLCAFSLAILNYCFLQLCVFSGSSLEPRVSVLESSCSFGFFSKAERQNPDGKLGFNLILQWNLSNPKTSLKPKCPASSFQETQNSFTC